MMQRIEKTFAGRKLVIETGRMAKQAAGSAVVTFGETMVLAAVTVSEKVSTLPFFPLTVEYKERTYAAGKIPGGFIKREGRPQDAEILSGRVIDRTIRPLFPEGFQNEVQVFIYVISADQENDADVLALLAVSYALNASTPRRAASRRWRGRKPSPTTTSRAASRSSPKARCSTRSTRWTSTRGWKRSSW